MNYSHDDIAALTAAVRKADRDFETAGGSSRHWIRDHFLPELEAAGFQVVRLSSQPVASSCTCEALTSTWRSEDRAALCGHLKDCPLFASNFTR